MDVSRRGLIGMLAAGVGAAIVRPGIIMPIKPMIDLNPAILPEFSTDNLIVKATERYSTRFRVYGTDAFGNKVTETIDIGQVGKIEFKTISSWHSDWSAVS